MSLSSLLLRVLLSVTLIANGIGFAQASARMQLIHAQHAELQVQTKPVAVANAGCHEHQAAAPIEPPAPHDAMHHGAGKKAAADASECCKGRTCQCACAQQAPVAFVPATFAGLEPLRATVIRRGATQHAAPALPHLIRPPIG